MNKEEYLKQEKNKAGNEIKEEKVNFEDKKYNKSNEEEYIKEAWNDFLKYGSNDFETYMGYGPKEIQNIDNGISKFIKAMDWNSLSDIINKKWRTDTLKVVLCSDCSNDFTTFNMDYGLCKECKKNYKLDEFEQSLAELQERNEQELITDSMVNFVFYKEFRKFYKKMTFEEELKELEEDNFLNAKTPNFITRLIESDNKDNIDLVIEKMKNSIKVLESKNTPPDILLDTIRVFSNKSYDSKEKKRKKIFQIYYARN